MLFLVKELGSKKYSLSREIQTSHNLVLRPLQIPIGKSLGTRLVTTHNFGTTLSPLKFSGNSFYIIQSFVLFSSRVQLNRRFGSSASLDLMDKLLDSLRARINSTSDDKKEAFLHRLRNAISENIKLQAAIQDKEHGEKLQE